ncbi:MAG: hypothetical protein AB7N76_06945 [Planctomycetota bacterium]
MSFWRRLFGGGGADEVGIPASSMPARLEAVPGELVVEVSQGRVTGAKGAVPCWVYRSDGFLARGQQELLLVLRRGREGSAPLQPVVLFRTLHRLAAQGRCAEAGSMTMLGEGDLLGFKGVLYTRPNPPDGLAVPTERALSLTLVTARELQVAQRAGGLRILARLGKHVGHFPYPPWSTPGRKEVPLPELESPSAVDGEGVRCAGAGLSVVSAADAITLRIGASAAPGVRARLAEAAPDAALLFLCQLDPEADALLVWEGQPEPAALTPPVGGGERISGCFLAVLPAAESSCHVLEDGFGVPLAPPDLARLRAALAAGEGLELELSQGGRLRVEWLEGEPAPEARPAGTTRFLETALAQSEEELVGRVDPSGLAVYVSSLAAAVEAHFAARERGARCELLVEVELASEGGPFVAVRADPELADDLLGELPAALRALAPLPVKGDVGFQLRFEVWR